jgi:CysZ protein
MAHPRLWGWVIAPAIVTLVVLAAAIAGVVWAARPLVERANEWLPSWAETIVWVLVIAALGFGALLVFVSVVGVVAGPFNELLSEAVEEQITGIAGPPFAFGAFMKEAIAGVLHALRRLIVFVLGALVLFAIAFIPVVGTIAAAVIGFVVAARGTAYDCYDAVLARRRMEYRAKLDFLARHRGRSLGLGAAVTGLLLVPGVNLIALGLGAVGATLAVHDLERVERS